MRLLRIAALSFVMLMESAWCSTGCALPPTLIPVCAWQPGVICRPPARAILLGGRDVEWEAHELCPARTDLHFRSCYVRAGMRDGRAVYVFVVP